MYKNMELKKDNSWNLFNYEPLKIPCGENQVFNVVYMSVVAFIIL